MKTRSMKSQAKTPAKTATPSALPAPGVAQARMAQFRNGPKITAPPVYRPRMKEIAKKVVQPKFAGSSGTIQRADDNPYKKDYKTYTPLKA